MKKIRVTFLIVMVATVTLAELSINWKSMGGAVTASSGGTDYLVGSTIYLMWSATGPITGPGPYEPINPGEYVLDIMVTSSNSLWNGGGGTYSDADVGGNDIHSGFFWTRIFETDGSAGDYFLDIAMGLASDYVYNPLFPWTVYCEDVVVGIQWIGQNGTGGILTPLETTNGVPYAWLDQYGLVTDISDPDLDGYLSWQEYYFGTNPTNALSFFTVRISGSALTWDVITGRTYSVESTTNLTSGFIQITNELTIGTFTMPTVNEAMYFRIGVEIAD